KSSMVMIVSASTSKAVATAGAGASNTSRPPRPRPDLLPPPVVRRHEPVPLPVVAQHVGSQHPVVVALELDHVLVLRLLPLGAEVRALGVQRQHLAGGVQAAVVHPTGGSSSTRGTCRRTASSPGHSRASRPSSRSRRRA